MSLFDILRWNVYLNEEGVWHKGVPPSIIYKWKSESPNKSVCTPEGVARLKKLIEEYEDTNEPF